MCESRHAVIFRITDDMQKGVDEEQQMWRTCILNAPFEFKVLVLVSRQVLERRRRVKLFVLQFASQHTVRKNPYSTNAVSYLIARPATAVNLRPSSFVVERWCAGRRLQALVGYKGRGPLRRPKARWSTWVSALSSLDVRFSLGWTCPPKLGRVPPRRRAANEIVRAPCTCHVRYHSISFIKLC